MVHTLHHNGFKRCSFGKNRVPLFKNARIFVTFSWLEVCRCSQRLGCYLQGPVGGSTFRWVNVAPVTRPSLDPRCPQEDGHRSCSTWVGAKSLVVQVRVYNWIFRGHGLLGDPRKLGSMVSKWAITTYEWDINWGYIPLTNLLLASWDIQVFMEIMFFFLGGRGKYPSSHNHGSVENGCISNISFLSFWVIHDYGKRVEGGHANMSVWWFL